VLSNVKVRIDAFAIKQVVRPVVVDERIFCRIDFMWLGVVVVMILLLVNEIISVIQL
jgi:hypothetical protein